MSNNYNKALEELLSKISESLSTPPIKFKSAPETAPESESEDLFMEQGNYIDREEDGKRDFHTDLASLATSVLSATFLEVEGHDDLKKAVAALYAYAVMDAAIESGAFKTASHLVSHVEELRPVVKDWVNEKMTEFGQEDTQDRLHEKLTALLGDKAFGECEPDIGVKVINIDEKLRDLPEDSEVLNWLKSLIDEHDNN